MDKKKQGVYEGSSGCQQNMVLTSGAFLHRVSVFGVFLLLM
jgi:hypothetical protein